MRYRRCSRIVEAVKRAKLLLMNFFLTIVRFFFFLRYKRFLVPGIVLCNFILYLFKMSVFQGSLLSNGLMKSVAIYCSSKGYLR